jgi:hypothetical protein
MAMFGERALGKADTSSPRYRHHVPGVQIGRSVDASVLELSWSYPL